VTRCVFRPARPGDGAAVLAFTSHTWEWGDYIADVWQTWLADPEGELCVGELDDRVVAVGKLSLLASREGWLEGQRVDPAFRQQGIALALTGYLTERAQQLELRVLRLATHSANTAVHRIAARLGYHRVATVAPFASDGLGAGAPTLAVLQENHYSEIQNWLGRSPILRAAGGLFGRGWAWQELTAKRVHGLLAEGQVLGLLGPQGGLRAFAVLGSRGRLGEPMEGLEVGYVDGDWRALEDLALGLRGAAVARGADTVHLMLIDEPTLRSVFQAAGFRNELEGRDLWVYERVL